MTRKESFTILGWLLLIPLALMLGGALANFINPEIAAGHPDYSRNFQLLSAAKRLLFFGGVGCAGVCWIVACLKLIRAKHRSEFWLVFAAAGPVGLAVLASLNDGNATQLDRYSQLMCRMRWYVRIVYESACFFAIWWAGFELMALHRTLRIWFESITTGVSIAQIIEVENASSGMWAFGEMTEVMFLVVLLYALRPLLFNAVSAMVWRSSRSQA